MVFVPNFLYTFAVAKKKKGTTELSELPRLNFPYRLISYSRRPYRPTLYLKGTTLSPFIRELSSGSRCGFVFFGGKMKQETFNEEFKSRINFCGRVIKNASIGMLTMYSSNTGTRYSIEREGNAPICFGSLEKLEAYCENLLLRRPKPNYRTSFRRAQYLRGCAASFN